MYIHSCTYVRHMQGKLQMFILNSKQINKKKKKENLTGAQLEGRDDARISYAVYLSKVHRKRFRHIECALLGGISFKEQ